MAKKRRTVDVLIEIPRGSRSKYELDKKNGRLRLSRVLSSSVHYRTDYGFVIDTTAEDGDQLDVLLLVEEPSLPGSVQSARPIGLLDMTDGKGLDVKILAVPEGDARFSDVAHINDLPDHWCREIKTFFETYKQLDRKAAPKIRSWHGPKAAWRAIDSGRKQKK